MARQFTTFSVVDILGESPREDSTEHSFSRQGGSDVRSPHDVLPFASFKPGSVNQMLPPLPATLTSSNAPTPRILQLYDHDPVLSPTPEKDVEVLVETRSQTKRGTRKGKGAKKRSRVSSDIEEPSIDVEEDEDDVFLTCRPPSLNSSRHASSSASASAHNQSVTNSLVVAAARDLNSAGETSTPSPPTPKHSNKQQQTKNSASKQTEEDDDDEEQPKKKRARTAYSRDQLHNMERYFRKSAYPDNHQLKIISNETNIAIPKVQVWFQNRRAKARKWGQMLPEPSSNTALYRGALPTHETSRYLPPLQPSSSSSTLSTLSSTPNNPTPPTSHTSLLTTTPSPLIQPYITPSPYQRCFYPPPPYPLPPSYPLFQSTCPLPYPIPYPLYPGVPSTLPLTSNTTQHGSTDQPTSATNTL